ncbi:hypothetical protein HYU45_01005 [Candidatus Daviesbacteria bacterium]|nr:hypothetical protein [Candidatus Daviesbacteria bacterium]
MSAGAGRVEQLNQVGRKFQRHGEKQLNLPPKELRAITRRERQFQKALDCEAEKQNRVWERIQRGLGGYDGTDCLVLRKEINYLSRCGISVDVERG